MRNAVVKQLGILAFFLSSTAHAGLFYSIDTASDDLVSIDSSSGHVTMIGSLGVDLFDTDLAMLEGNLYAVDTSLVRQTANLYRINTTSGNAALLGQLATATEGVTHAEGLAATASSLIVSYTTTPNSPTSNLVAALSLTGLVGSGTDAGVDIDGLTADNIEQFLFLDSKDSANRVDLYSGFPVSTIGSHTGVSGSNFSNDAAFLGNELFAISDPGLLHLDRTDGSLLSITALDRAGNYTGLVAVPAPMPLFLILGGLAAATMFGRSRSRSKSSLTQNEDA
jgi:hypothetical protein